VFPSLQTTVIILQVELKATAVHLIGECNQDTYPLQKKRHSLPYLRSISHLRPRTNTLGAVTRVRSALAFATHQFFRECGFQCIHTPILSASDCEGAGEMFQVSFRASVCYTCVLSLPCTGALPPCMCMSSLCMAIMKLCVCSTNLRDYTTVLHDFTNHVFLDLP